MCVDAIAMQTVFKSSNINCTRLSVPMHMVFIICTYMMSEIGFAYFISLIYLFGTIHPIFSDKMFVVCVDIEMVSA